MPFLDNLLGDPECRRCLTGALAIKVEQFRDMAMVVIQLVGFENLPVFQLRRWMPLWSFDPVVEVYGLVIGDFAKQLLEFMSILACIFSGGHATEYGVPNAHRDVIGIHDR